MSGPYDKLKERYQNDMEFKQLVDFMIFHIRELRFSPGEMRQAAVLAEIEFQSRYPRPTMIVRDGKETYFASGLDPSPFQ